MGLGRFLKKAKSNVSRVGKSITRSVGVAAKSGLNIAKDISKGDLNAAAKDFGRGAGAGFNIATGGLANTRGTKEFLNSKFANTVSFGLAKDSFKINRGFSDLEKTGETDSRFYKSIGSALGKVGAAYAVVATGGLAYAGQAASSGYSSAGAYIGGLSTTQKAVGALALVAAAGGKGRTAAGAVGLGKVADLIGIEDRAPSSSGSYYAPVDNSESGVSLPIIPIAIATAGIGAYFLLRKKR